MPFSVNNTDPGDPNQDLVNALQAAENDEAYMKEQRQELLMEVGYMMALLSQAAKDPMKAFEAMQYAQTVVLPGMAGMNATSMVQVSDGMNVASALRAFMAYIQKYFNEGKNISSGDATKLANALKELWAYLNNNAELRKILDQDPGMRDSLISAIKSIFNAFGAGDNPNGLNGNDVQKDMQKWFAGNTTDLGDVAPPWPGKLYPILIHGDHNHSASPNSKIDQVNDALAQFTTSVSAISQTLQTMLQYEGNQYNQIMGTLQNIFNAMKTIGMTEVQNENAR